VATPQGPAPGQGTLRFERLPETRREGKAVAGLLGARLWAGDEATRRRLLDYRGPRVLHLATQGYFLSEPQREPGPGGGVNRAPDLRWESPLLLCGLALAGANRRPAAEAAEGLLTGRDVSGLDLLGTELVTLSASEAATVGGTGRSLSVLQRCFLLAGARTLLLSLWRAPEPQRQELLADFYRRILAGQPRAEALREAKLALKARHPDPLHWGALVCYGEPGAMTMGR
jgi:CHAT domain-containing protein